MSGSNAIVKALSAFLIDLGLFFSLTVDHLPILTCSKWKLGGENDIL